MVDQINFFVTSDVKSGALNALVKNIMKQMGIADPHEAIRRVNSGEWVVFKSLPKWREENNSLPKWREENNIIRFRITSNGMTGEEWIGYFKENGYNVSDYAKSILLSSDFQPTNGIVYEMAVIKGDLFNDQDRTTNNIRAEAGKRKFEKPNAETACLIRKDFSDNDLKDMGLYWIIAMHEPINDSVGDPSLLGAYRFDVGRWLDASYGLPDRRWSCEGGFAFAVSQESVL